MKRLLTTILLTFLSVSLAAQTAVVTRTVNLRPDPSTAQTPIAKLTPQTQLQLLETGSTNGYLHVKVTNQSGWVWSKNVQTTQSTPSKVTGGGEMAAGSAPATAISSDWDKPAPQSASFESDEGNCGETGDGGDTDTNQRKNRTDVQASYHAVTWAAINTLGYAKGAKKSRMDWTPAQLATITPFEGAAISVEGYLYKVKVESSSVNAKSGGESTNCHARLANDVDWHMPLTANVGEGEDVAIIVETTPRVRRQHSQWTTARLKPWVSHIGNTPNANYNQQKIRISGWLMLDPEHQDMINQGLRSTLWEIHPITKIEVWDNGSWVDLDNP
ncbi:MAG: SH3 domain-containing protein [Candidatus Sulfotelmatobacter sp.]